MRGSQRKYALKNELLGGFFSPKNLFPERKSRLLSGESFVDFQKLVSSVSKYL